MLLTNGLLHPGKGIDLVLRALPGVVKHHPEVLYVVAGRPHPTCGATCVDHVRWLKGFVQSSGLGAAVTFVEKFSSEEELVSLLQVGC